MNSIGADARLHRKGRRSEWTTRRKTDIFPSKQNMGSIPFFLNQIQPAGGKIREWGPASANLRFRGRAPPCAPRKQPGPIHHPNQLKLHILSNLIRKRADPEQRNIPLAGRSKPPSRSMAAIPRRISTPVRS
jgi:hypothetical protein